METQQQSQISARMEAFDGLELKIIEQDGEEWFSAEDIGKALGLEEPRIAVIKIFNRHREEFEGLCRVTSLVTWLKSGLKTPRRFTTFNPQGAYLLAILARTPKSIALRRWLAKFMAHDLNRLREGVGRLQAENAALKAGREADQARVRELEARLKGLPDPALAKETRRLKKEIAELKLSLKRAEATAGYWLEQADGQEKWLREMQEAERRSQGTKEEAVLSAVFRLLQDLHQRVAALEQQPGAASERMEVSGSRVLMVTPKGYEVLRWYEEDRYGAEGRGTLIVREFDKSLN